MTAPYWQRDGITLYLGDCREVAEWLSADVLVTDPPYGIDWEQGSRNSGARIAGDLDTAARDTALTLWGDRPAMAFGDLLRPVPAGTKQVLIYAKPKDAGVRVAVGGWRRDVEAIYLLGSWHRPPITLDGRSSVVSSGARMVSGSIGTVARYGHPHAKPVDVMETLIAACPPGVIADPFAGAGSTLVAARNQGRRAIGVEVEERYAERAARRLDQGILVA